MQTQKPQPVFCHSDAPACAHKETHNTHTHSERKGGGFERERGLEDGIFTKDGDVCGMLSRAHASRQIKASARMWRKEGQGTSVREGERVAGRLSACVQLLKTTASG